MGVLRQSTASQTVMVGPFMDSAGAVQSSLTIANTDIKVSKAGAAAVNKSTGGATHDVNGMYSFTLDATDTNTVGILKVSINVSPALVVCASYQVLEEAVFDALYAASAAGYSTLTAAQVWSEATRTITGMGTDAISAAALSAAAANKQSDHVLRRQYGTARASSDGDAITNGRSLLGADAKLVNRTEVNGNNLEIYHEDDATLFYTQALTTDPTADPITGVNTN